MFVLGFALRFPWEQVSAICKFISWKKLRAAALSLSCGSGGGVCCFFCCLGGGERLFFPPLPDRKAPSSKNFPLLQSSYGIGSEPAARTACPGAETPQAKPRRLRSLRGDGATPPTVREILCLICKAKKFGKAEKATGSELQAETRTLGRRLGVSEKPSGFEHGATSVGRSDKSNVLREVFKCSLLKKVFPYNFKGKCEPRNRPNPCYY